MTIVSTVSKFHPAIEAAIVAEGANVEAVLAEVNAVLAAFDSTAEHGGSVSTKTGKKEDTRTVRLSAKGKLPKTPAGLLVRINDYLGMSRELYCKVEKIELPLSVKEWVNADRFAEQEA